MKRPAVHGVRHRPPLVLVGARQRRRLPETAQLAAVGLHHVADVDGLALHPPVLDLVIEQAVDVRRCTGLDGGVEAVVAGRVVWQLFELECEPFVFADRVEPVVPASGSWCPHDGFELCTDQDRPIFSDAGVREGDSTGIISRCVAHAWQTVLRQVMQTANASRSGWWMQCCCMGSGQQVADSR